MKRPSATQLRNNQHAPAPEAVASLPGIVAGLLCLCLVSTVAVAEDWPTYMHDSARSGVTGDALTFPMAEQWVYRPPAPLKPAWPKPQEGYNELPKLDFDYALCTVAVDGTVFFGSSVDDAVYALNIATGAVRWRFVTGAPVRLSPTVAHGLVYVGSDDGYVYCLKADDGTLVWKSSGAADPKPVLGSGRVMALSPVRTGVLVRDDTAWFGAGVFPRRDVWLYAVDAASGEVRWQVRSDSRDLSPQGHLLASDTLLFIPSGREIPAACLLADGAMQEEPGQAKPPKGMISGSYGLVAGSELLFGSQHEVFRLSYETGGMRIRSRSPRTDRILLRDGTTFRMGGPKSARPSSRTEPITILRVDGPRGGPYDPAPAWTYQRAGMVSMILAGETLVAGTSDGVVAVDARSGREVWKAPVDGKALGLTAAGGRLFVSTDKGTIHCFGPGPVAEARARGRKPEFPETAALATALADELVKNLDCTNGYAVVLGENALDVSVALARASEMSVYCVLRDEFDTASARTVLADAGLHGTRVTVLTGTAEALPLPDYMANLVVDVASPGKPAAGPAELLRILKPCGGVLVQRLPLPSGERRPEASDLSPATEFEVAGSRWARFVRGDLPGSGWWTSGRADPGNTGSSDDKIVETPLKIIWYGEPGPGEFPDRHQKGSPPLVRRGRVVCQGYEHGTERNYVFSFDAYNGVRYWERDLPGAVRLNMLAETGNTVVSDRSVFVLAGSQCHRFDLYTGEPVCVYDADELGQDDDASGWGYLMVADHVLVGSTRIPAGRGFSGNIFAVDLATGKLLWVYRGRVIRNTTIAILDGSVIFVEDRNPETDRTQRPRSPLERSRLGLEDEPPLLRSAVALDLKTGRELWARDVDLTACGYWAGGLGNLYGVAKSGVYVICGAYHTYGRQTGRDQRRALALATHDGSTLWAEAVANKSAPVIVGDALLVEPDFRDLKTGEPLVRRNRRGKLVPWAISRSGGACGTVSASAAMLFFRSGVATWHDLQNESREYFWGVRPGCWINMVAAGGVLVQVEASSGCNCYYSVQGTFVLSPHSPGGSGSEGRGSGNH